MYTKYFFTLIVVITFLFPMQYAFASQEVPSTDALVQQIGALQKYVQKIKARLGLAQYETLDDSVIRDSILQGTKWLVASQEDSGHFAYEYEPYKDSYLGGDNIVRQAGALFALSEVARRDVSGDEERTEAIENAITYFETLSPEHDYEGTSVRCLTKNKTSNVCMLGATALALSGILGYVEANPEKGSEYEELIEKYLTFILTSKKPDAGFLDEYRLNIGFRSEKESSFSNGESLLALVRYYQHNPRTDVKEVIEDTFAYIEHKEFDTPLYLWAMAALKDMHAMWPDETYVAYAQKFTTWRMDSLRRNHGTIRNYCASTEGLASAYSVLENNIDPVLLRQLRSEIDFWNAKNFDLQIMEGDTYRLVPENGQVVLTSVIDMPQSQGGFLTADDELTQRIDFTQHCVSTYLQTLVDIDGKTL